MQSMGGTKILPQLLTSMQRDGSIKPLAAAGIPITIAWCEYDRVIPFQLRAGAPMLEAVPGARAETVKAPAMCRCMTNPGKVVDMVLYDASKAGGQPYLILLSKVSSAGGLDQPRAGHPVGGCGAFPVGRKSFCDIRYASERYGE